MAEVTDAQLTASDARGRALMASEPRAAAARFDTASGRVVVDLFNGCSYAFPASLVQDLKGASAAALKDVRVDGVGFNLHWPALEVDLYVPALVAGVFGTRTGMKGALARMAGQTKSSAKAAAARTNGAKGGRPRKARLG